MFRFSDSITEIQTPLKYALMLPWQRNHAVVYTKPPLELLSSIDGTSHTGLYETWHGAHGRSRLAVIFWE